MISIFEPEIRSRAQAYALLRAAKLVAPRRANGKGLRCPSAGEPAGIWGRTKRRQRVAAGDVEPTQRRSAACNRRQLRPDRSLRPDQHAHVIRLSLQFKLTLAVLLIQRSIFGARILLKQSR